MRTKVELYLGDRDVRRAIRKHCIRLYSHFALTNMIIKPAEAHEQYNKTIYDWLCSKLYTIIYNKIKRKRKKESVLRTIEVTLQQINYKQLIEEFRLVRNNAYITLMNNYLGKELRSVSEQVPATREIIERIKTGELHLLLKLAAPVQVIVKVSGILSLGTIGYKSAVLTLDQLRAYLLNDDLERLLIIEKLYPALMHAHIHIIKPKYIYENDVAKAAVTYQGATFIVRDEEEIVKYMQLHNKRKARVEWWVDKTGIKHNVKQGKRIHIPIKRVHTIREGTLTIYAKLPVVTNEPELKHELIKIFELKIIFHGHYAKYPNVLIKLFKTLIRELKRKNPHDQEIIKLNELLVNKIANRNYIAVEIKVNNKKLVSPVVALILNKERLLKRKFKAEINQLLESPRIKYWWYLPYKIQKNTIIFGNQAIHVVDKETYKKIKKKAKTGRTIKNIDKLEPDWFKRNLNHVLLFNKTVDVKVLFFDNFNVWGVEGPVSATIFSRHHPERYVVKARAGSGEYILFVHKDPNSKVKIENVLKSLFLA